MKLRHVCLSLALLSAPPALAETPAVATDIAAVHSLAAQVMAGAGEPDLVIPPGASPHGYALRPSEAAALEAADLVFHVGGGLTPWLDGALENLAGDARVVALIEVPGTVRLAARETPIFAEDRHGDDAAHDHDHEEEHDHADEDAHGHGDEGNHENVHEHDHDHSGIDTHAWLDPENARLWLDTIAGALAAADPENAARYRRNAAAGKARIAAAEQDIRVMLAPVRGARFLVFHDAYQYFERRFGLTVAGAISVSDARRPGPARLARLRDRLAGLDIACAFAEPQFDPGLVGAVLEGGKVRTAVLDPMGADIPPGPGFYTALLTGMAAAIAECA